MKPFGRDATRPLRLLAAVVLAAVTVSTSGIASAGVGRAHPGPKVETSAGKILEGRLDSSLRDNVEADDANTVPVMVFVDRGAKPPKTLIRPVRIRLKAEDEMDVWAGRAKNESLTKLASAKGVVRVEDNRAVEPPVLPDVRTRTSAERRATAIKAKAAIEKATELGVIDSWAATFDADGRPATTPDEIGTGSGSEPTGWMDVGETHKSAAAWAAGYTGAGVTVGVADTGVDFAHPDLQDTWATVTDPDSPYYGWPLAYDPYSLLVYDLDVEQGTNYVASGYSWFSDTSATLVRGVSGTGGFDGRTYVLPDVSLSGSYHIGYHNDESLNYYLGPIAVLVTDENTPGVYDTVRVDIGGDQDFTNDKPCTKASPLSYLDYWDSAAADYGSDGYADLSGGMLYWIADGTNQPPGFGIHFNSADAPGSGDLVCFMGSLDAGQTHGTLCASNIVGQGVIDGASVANEYPTFKGTGTGGIVQGAGKDADLVGIGDIYSANATFYMAYDFAAFGLDGVPGTGDELQALSCSFGDSSVDNDGWDYESRYVTELNEKYAEDTVYVFSTGNGAPGYGTVAPPSPVTGISVGASTQFGACGGWDSIDDGDQVTRGDVIGWSNRGPGAMGDTGVSVVADGAYSSGDVPLNDGLWDGWTSWEIWGGTSRSTPVTVGNLTLVQQAFKDKNGRWPTWSEARTLMMSGAQDLSYDSFVQGAGMVDALRSTSLAAETDGVAVTPSTWEAGDYRGVKRDAFANVMHAGDTDTTTLSIENRGASASSVTLSDVWHQRAWTETYDVVLDPDQESDYDFSRPDYLRDLTSDIQANGGADLLVIRTAYPLSEMDPTGQMSADSSDKNDVRVLAYDWTDVDAGGDVWSDDDTDGYVDDGEMDPGEYMRFSYGYGRGTSHEIRVQNPLERSHDGVLLGLQHRNRGGGGLVHVRVEVSGWDRVDWPWLSLSDSAVDVTAGSNETVDAQLDVPGDAPVGIYEGQVLVTDEGGRTSVVPVSVNVAAGGASTAFGGASPYETLMDNAKVFGYQDWTWRPESGDWRFFFTDVPAGVSSQNGDRLVVSTEWENTPTDVDTLIYGPEQRPAGWPSGDDSWGPYDLGLKGGSVNTNLGAGVWGFQTGTGGAGEWVSSGLDEGLNEIMLHNVLYAGTQVGEGFSGRTGTVSCLPLDVDSTVGPGGVKVPLSFSSRMDLPNLVASGYGLSEVRSWKPSISTGQDWFSAAVSVTDAPYLEVSCASDVSDLDLFLQRYEAGSWVTVGASASSSGNESIKVDDPEPGDYRIDVYGYAVATPVETVTVEAHAPQGGDLTVTGLPVGAVASGADLSLPLACELPAGAIDGRVYEGVVYLGISAAPKMIEIPVRVVADLNTSAPASFTATKGYQSAALAWSNPGADYAVTRVLRSTGGYASGPNDTAGQAVIFEGAGTSFVATGLAPGTRYYFTAFNRDASGNWSTSSAAEVDLAIPSPSSLKAVAGYRQVSLTWGNSGDYAATRILRSTSGYATGPNDTAGQTRVFEAAGTSFKNTGLTAGRIYYYTAYNRDATGNWSTVPAKARATAQGKVSLSKPKLKPSTPRHGKKFKVTGSISPKHTSKTKVVLRFYRKVGKTYGKTPYKSVTVTVKARSTSYATSVTLKKSGTYRVKAYHADTAHAASYSSIRTFKMK